MVPVQDKRMNICYISDVDISSPNGPGVNEQEFVVSLSEKLNGAAIFIISEPQREIEWHPQEVHFYPRVRSSFLLKSNLQILLYSMRQICEFRKVAKARDIDLVVFRLNYNSILCAIYIKMIGRAYAIKTLGYKGIFKEKRSTNLFRLIFWRILSWLFNQAVQGAVAIDVCTVQYFRYYSRRLPVSKVEIVENSVNVKRFYPKNRMEMRAKLGLTRFNKIVGYVGGSPSERGAAQLVEISPELTNFSPDCGIIIVGSDHQLDELKRRAKQLGTEDRFVWVGIIPYEMVADYMNSFDVGIALDTADRIKYIGNSSQKIRQYLACGVPVICPKETNLFVREEKLGVLVGCHDLNKIFVAIKNYLLLSNPEAEEFSRRAVKYVHENLSSDIAMKKRLRFWGKNLEKNY
jgi:glycosyltransferase involved in cell wall biosynthesis